jgi:hypothetical protein
VRFSLYYDPSALFYTGEEVELLATNCFIT